MLHRSGFHRRTPILIALVLVLTPLLMVSRPQPASAAGVVSECTEPALRAALAGGGLVTFSGCGTITLGSQLEISQDTTIDGGGAVTLDGQDTTRLIQVNDGVALELLGLTLSGGFITGGPSGGGAILNFGSLSITASTLSGNASDFGGAIANFGVMTLATSTFNENLSVDGGALDNRDGGTATLTASTLSGNVALLGGAITNSGDLTLTASTLSGNIAEAAGGAITNNGDLTLTASTLNGNTAQFEGGAIFINPGATATITASTLSGNSVEVDDGGAIRNGGTLTIITSTLSGNSAPGDGGAITNSGDLTLTASTLSGNGAFGGGAIINNPGATATITASTLSGNGAIIGGAIINNGNLALVASTLADNTVVIAGEAISNGGDLTLTASILDGSRLCNGLVSSGGYNVVRDTTCNLAGIGDLQGEDPLLGDLQDNGGPTQTILPDATDSPALDRVPNAVCTTLAVSTDGRDQRGAPRPERSGLACDSGAVEVPVLLTAILSPAAVTIGAGGSYAGTGSFTSDRPGPWEATIDYGDGSPADERDGLQPNVGIPITHHYLDLGNYTITLTICDTSVNRCDTAEASVTVTAAQVDVTLDPAAVTLGEGSSYQGTGSFSTNGSGPWAATVDYGDGAGPQDLGSVAPGVNIPISHQYLSAGDYTITLEVCDGGLGRCSSAQASVTVTEVQILVTLDPASVTIAQGGSYTGSGTFSSDGQGPFRADVFFDDGSLPESLGEFQPGQAIPISHQFLTAGQYTIRLEICDTLVVGRCGEALVNVTVTVAQIVVTVEPDSATIDEGQSFEGVGSFTSNTPGPFTATVFYGDFSVPQELGEFAPGDDIPLSHQYFGGGERTLRLQICDNTVFQCGDGQATITVTPLAPVVNIEPVSLELVQGETFQASGSFVDVGLGGWSATVSWGDEVGQHALPLNDDRTFSLNHVYLEPGEFVVTVRVCDAFACGQASVTVVVSAAQLVAELAPESVTIGEGGSYQGEGAFTTNSTGPWTASVAYDDGSSPQELGSVTPGTPIPISHQYLVTGIYTITVEICDTTVNRCGTATANVTVTAVAPSVTISPVSLNIGEGDTFQASGSFTDPGLGPWTAAVDYGQGAGPQPLALTPSNTFSLSRQYLQQGSFLVTVAVCDAANACDSASVVVAVGNVPPDIQDVQVTYNGSRITFNVIANDPGGGPLTYRFECAGGVLGPQSSPMAICDYLNQTGQFAVVVEVIDANQVTVSETVVVEIPTYLCVGERSGTPRYMGNPGGCARGEQPLVLTAAGSWAFCVGERSGSLRYLPNSSANCLRGEWHLTLPQDGPITVCVGERSKLMRYAANAASCNPRGELVYRIANRVAMNK